MAASSSTPAGTITIAAYATAREPLPAEWDTLHGLHDILHWAKLKGSADHLPSWSVESGAIDPVGFNLPPPGHEGHPGSVFLERSASVDL